MKVIPKILIVLAVACAVVGTVVLKARQRQTQPPDRVQTAAAVSTSENVAEPSDQSAAKPETAKTLPKLLELGADKCIPCKMMAPILDELKKEYAGRLDVEFIDVWQHPKVAEQYGVRVIPTQIFIDESGKERFRHQGFFAKEDILSKWHELGYEFNADTSTIPAQPANSQ